MKNKLITFLLLITIVFLSFGCERRELQVEEERKIVKEVFEPFKVESTLPSTGVLKVQAAKLSSPEKTKVLVSNGIPFAPGQLFYEKNFAIFDKDGKEMPIAVTVLAKWRYDNSIRSLLVQFSLEIEHKYKLVYMQWGKPRTTQDLEITEVDWVLPEGFMVLPAEWLCLSQVTGEQVPVGRHSFPKYDENVEKHYPKRRDFSWTGKTWKDSYYDTPHVFYQLYVRTGDDEYFKSARREALHYRDDQVFLSGPEKGRAKDSKKYRYIYIQGMVDDYLLTGDPKSLIAAGYMAEYLKNHFEPSKAFFKRNDTRFWTERLAAFPFLGAISYYKLTGEEGYLLYAQRIMQNLYKTQNEWPGRGGFIHNLYSHDPEEGARRDEYGGSPYMTGVLLEAIIKYHKLTNSNIAKDSIFKALDWLIKEALTPDGRSFIYLTCDKRRNERHPDLNLLIAHAFGYGYKISEYKRRDYLQVGEMIFEEGINNAYLGTRKHFNQNYRSSGHFLAYITDNI